ncbi:MAG: acyl-[ACP]--phospholipid O-acyltransferase [Hyphomicrobiaceae bacterium]|nr:acyl-[ACP]--phospholipid O-acyltransferase [Hyphomicrobiaceae bacterium]
MSGTQFDLLTTKRFLPLFLTQALGALNDNVFKNALAILIIYRIAELAGMNGQVLVTAAAGIFILPFFLFSATAGQLADKFEKSGLIRKIKLAEIVIMVMGAGSLLLGNVYAMMGVLFLMGAQSTLFGPLKYSILPDHLKKDELIGGNALIEAGTFLAILAGTIAGGLLILGSQGTLVISGLVILLALLGFLASLSIPQAGPAVPDLQINRNFVDETWSMIKTAGADRTIFLSILGISWFWLVGATFLSQFPALAKDVLHGDETVVTLFLTVFSVGIALGSLLCNRLLEGAVTAKYVPFGALGITLFIIDLYFATNGVSVGAQAASLAGATEFLVTPANYRILADLLGISICGGLFIVPLYAILQTEGEEKHRARTIAANNIVNALFIVAGALAASGLLMADLSVPTVLLLMGLINGVVAVYICKLLPDAIIKAILLSVLKVLFRIEVRGMEHYKKAGKRAVIVVNHVSFLDPLLLAVFLPVKPIFAVNTHIAQAWWVRPFLTLVDAFPVDPTNPMAMKSLIKAVQQDRHCVIFPEGRITVTGALMKVFEGPGMVADKSDARIVPIRIDGAQYTLFSRMKGKIRLRLFPKITMTILPPQNFEVSEDLSGRARRQAVGAKLYDVMSDMVFETCDRKQTLFEAVLDAQAIHGRRHRIVEDIERKPISYGRLVLGAMTLGRKLRTFTKKGEFVGFLLPNSVGASVTFFALQAFGRVPAMLNFSTGLKNMKAALETADVKTVLTSRRFVEMAKLEDTVAALSKEVQIVYLDDLKDEITLADKLFAIALKPFSRLVHRRARIAYDDPAVVLFTSGSEGTPKGVVLSHENLLANRYQLGARIDFNPTDIVFNALPIFHSFGLTGGTLLPILSGVKTFLYPSPLHYRIVPALVYDTNATIMFGTDTFLTGYARVAHPYDFYSVRYVFAGAERVKDETRRVWADKFGLRIFEGYGATETSPVIAVNTPLYYQAGTVGRFMPGLAHELEPVPGIDEGGKLIVTGPNVMLGYLHHGSPGVIERVDGSRYDTGDIVSVDDQGFVTIRGRVKRFAKVAGEMVSLSAVEGYANTVWPDNMHAVTSIPCPRKGEELVLVTDKPDARREELLSFAKTQGIAELMIPKNIRSVEAIPLLGTGKVDYPGVSAMVGGR